MGWLWHERLPSDHVPGQGGVAPETSPMRRVAEGFSSSQVQFQFALLSAVPLIGRLLRFAWSGIVFLNLWGRDVANRSANSVSRATLDLDRLVDLDGAAGDERYRRHRSG